MVVVCAERGREYSGSQRELCLQREEEEQEEQEEERSWDNALFCFLNFLCLLLSDMCFSLVMLFLCLSQTELAGVWAQQQTGESSLFLSFHLCLSHTCWTSQVLVYVAASSPSSPSSLFSVQHLLVLELKGMIMFLNIGGGGLCCLCYFNSIHYRRTLAGFFKEQKMGMPCPFHFYTQKRVT